MRPVCQNLLRVVPCRVCARISPVWASVRPVERSQRYGSIIWYTVYRDRGRTYVRKQLSSRRRVRSFHSFFQRLLACALCLVLIHGKSCTSPTRHCVHNDGAWTVYRPSLVDVPLTHILALYRITLDAAGSYLLNRGYQITTPCNVD